MTIRTKTLVASAMALSIAGVSEAALIIDNSKIASGTVTGTMIVINSPGVSELPLNTNGTGGAQGPNWLDNSADGYVLTDRGVIDGGTQGTSPWETDGSATKGQLRTYRNGSGSPIITTYNWNLADSGIDLPDGAVINGIYASWTTRGTSGAIYNYDENGVSGATTESHSNAVGSVAAPTNLAINWTDSGSTVRTANFHKLDIPVITVTGGDGFTLSLQRSGNTHQSDAIILDVTIPEPSSLALLGIGGLLIARRRR